MDERAGAQPGESGPLAAVREEYLKLLLERFEGGVLEAYEYTSRVRAVERATSVVRMAEIVEAPVDNGPAPDALDMLVLARRTSLPAASDRRVKFLWPALLAVLLVVLLGVGLWLAAHAKALHNSGNLGLVPVGASPAGPA